MAMVSPATMYAVLLMAASHYCRAFHPEGNVGGDDSLVISPQVIFMLKARALDEINRCLRSDDIRIAVGDSTIGAVAKLAAFEAVFGEEEAYQQHMFGLMRMLEVRRTLGSSLGPLDQFLTRLVTWIDVNAAYFTGMHDHGVLDLGFEIQEPQPLFFAGTTQTRAEIHMSEVSTAA